MKTLDGHDLQAFCTSDLKKQQYKHAMHLRQPVEKDRVLEAITITAQSVRRSKGEC